MSSNISPEVKVLGMLSTPTEYYKYRPHLSRFIFSKECGKVLDIVDTWYAGCKDPVEWEAVRTTAALSSAGKPSTKHMLDVTIDNVITASLLPDPMVMDHFNRLEYASKISDIATKFVDGDTSVSLDDVIPLAKEYEKFLGTSSAGDIVDSQAKFDPSTWVAAMSPGGGLEWALEDMNVSLGPIRKGNLIVVGARPESGKTSFALHEAVHMALQLPENRPVLFLHNEESTLSVELRALQALFSCTTAEIMKDPAAAKEAFDKKMKGRFVLWQKNGFTVKEAERAIAYYDPGLIVYNVLPKVKGFMNQGGSSATDTTRLAELFKWARDIAIDQCPSIALMQAGAEAEGREWIYQNMLHGSKTDVCGEADGIITIGKSHSTSMDNVRFFHIAKNKLLGGTRTDPAKSHGFTEVLFDKHRCKFSQLAGAPIGSTPMKV